MNAPVLCLLALAAVASARSASPLRHIIEAMHNQKSAHAKRANAELVNGLVGFDDDMLARVGKRANAELVNSFANLPDFATIGKRANAELVNGLIGFGDLSQVGKRANAELVNSLMSARDLDKIGKRSVGLAEPQYYVMMK